MIPGSDRTSVAARPRHHYHHQPQQQQQQQQCGAADDDEGPSSSTPLRTLDRVTLTERLWNLGHVTPADAELALRHRASAAAAADDDGVRTAQCALAPTCTGGGHQSPPVPDKNPFPFRFYRAYTQQSVDMEVHSARL